MKYLIKDIIVYEDKPNLPITKAGRIQMILELCYPVDEDGNPLEPLLTEEQMLELLNGKE